MHPWRSDLPITEELAARLVADRFPELAGAPVRYLHEGWDSRAFLVGERLIFRLPKREEVARRLEVELALLPELEPLLPLAIPSFAFIGRPGPDYPWPFVGYAMIEGVMAVNLPIAKVDVERVAASFGAFLTALHGVPVERALAAGVCREDDRAELPAMRDRAARRLTELVPRLSDPIVGRGLRFLETHPTPEPGPLPAALLHNDLIPEHIVMAPDGSTARGIIDWGDVAIGDRSIDFAGLMEWGGRELVERVLRSYHHPIDDALIERARWRGLCSAVSDLHYGIESDRPAYVASGVAMIDRLLVEVGL